MSEFGSFDALKESPKDKALPIPFAGTTLPWLVTIRATTIAENRDVQLGSILDGLSVLEKLDNMEEGDNLQDVFENLDKAYSSLAQLLWVGFLTFEPDLSLEMVENNITYQSMGELPVQKMANNLVPQDEELQSEEEGKK
jgi:hypothetical protein